MYALSNNRPAPRQAKWYTTMQRVTHTKTDPHHQTVLPSVQVSELPWRLASTHMGLPALILRHCNRSCSTGLSKTGVQQMPNLGKVCVDFCGIEPPNVPMHPILCLVSKQVRWASPTSTQARIMRHQHHLIYWQSRQAFVQPGG